MSDIDSIYINFWGKPKAKFSEMEIALMEGGHSLEKPATIGKMDFIKSLTEHTMRAKEFLSENEQPIKLADNGRSNAKAWIDKVYSLYPTMLQNNHVMLWGQGEHQQMATFELTPSWANRGAVEVKWFQAYPLRQGVGSRAMAELQRLAREDGITLTLFPWDKGQVSQAKLTKFYKGHGFKSTAKGSKNLHWTPNESE